MYNFNLSIILLDGEESEHLPLVSLLKFFRNLLILYLTFGLNYFVSVIYLCIIRQPTPTIAG